MIPFIKHSQNDKIIYMGKRFMANRYEDNWLEMTYSHKEHLWGAS